MHLWSYLHIYIYILKLGMYIHICISRHIYVQKYNFQLLFIKNNYLTQSHQNCIGVSVVGWAPVNGTSSIGWWCAIMLGPSKKICCFSCHVYNSLEFAMIDYHWVLEHTCSSSLQGQLLCWAASRGSRQVWERSQCKPLTHLHCIQFFFFSNTQFDSTT